MSGEALQLANHNHQYSQKKVLTHLSAQPSSGGDPGCQSFFEKKIK